MAAHEEDITELLVMFFSPQGREHYDQAAD